MDVKLKQLQTKNKRQLCNNLISELMNIHIITTKQDHPQKKQ